MTYRVCLHAAAAAALLTGTACSAPGESSNEMTGATLPLGQGTVSSFATIGEDGVPAEIGVIFSAGAFDGLPAEPSQSGRCFDLNGDGVIGHGECEGDHQRDLPFPSEVRERADIPFEFSMVNWNPHGHDPEVWSVPHFDIHFYSIPESEVEAIALGDCGYFMDCAAFARATKPVPAQYVHADHANVGAAVGLMGNHLIDTQTPEFADPDTPFTHTWIFGAFDARIIFHEVMATHEFLTATDDLCHPIKQPQAWERAGHYPTRYCFRREADGGVRVYMTDFVMRPAG